MKECNDHSLTRTSLQFLNGPTRPLLSFIFDLFKQTSLQFLQQIYQKKCPSTIWCRNLNPQPLEHESPPITARPGLPPNHNECICIKNAFLKLVSRRSLCSTFSVLDEAVEKRISEQRKMIAKVNSLKMF